MPIVNYTAREITCKIVYCGPGRSGKTSNLLHVYGEHEFPVPPLALPPKEPRTKNREPIPPATDPVLGSRFSVLSSSEELTQYDAVKLFITRAQAAKADFTLTNDEMAAIAALARGTRIVNPKHGPAWDPA